MSFVYDYKVTHMFGLPFAVKGHPVQSANSLIKLQCELLGLSQGFISK